MTPKGGIWKKLIVATTALVSASAAFSPDRKMAREDLRAIVQHIGKDNPTRAKSFGKTLRDKTKPLAQHPDLGRPRRPGLPDYLRELVVHPNYIIFYRVLAEARTVQILRVKHATQQVP